MPNPSDIYRAAVDAAVAEHDRALAALRRKELSGELTGDEVASARRAIDRAFTSVLAVALSAYLDARK
jgi:hypothetical protein